MDFDYVVVPTMVLVVGIAIVWLSVRRMRLLSAKSYARWRKLTERIVLGIVIVAAVAVAASSSFNALAGHLFWAHNPPHGQICSVDGYKMHINCAGSGSPTIVLDAGLGNDSLIWEGIQPTLAKTTRVCSYDRAGFGWSDRRPAPRDADHIASELHQLLVQARITGPIVLMGHSISGIYMRDYATRYPANVVGIVFVDGSSPLQDENPAMKTTHKGPPAWMIRIVLSLGVPRVTGTCSPSHDGAGPHLSKLQTEDLCRLHYSSISSEMDSFHQSGAETAQTGPYDALPILIFSHDPARSDPGHKPTREDINAQNAWSQMQENLKKLSTRSRRIIARGSTHYVQLDRADLIKKEVPLFIEQIRGTAPQPTNYGSTVTE